MLKPPTLLKRTGQGIVVTSLLLSGRATMATAAEFTVGNSAEIATAAKTAQPGDVLVMKDGTWKDADILFEGTGTAEKPLTLRAQTAGKVILNGNSRLRINGSYLTVEGLWFKGGALASGEVIGFRDGPQKPAQHCRVTNCAVTDYNAPDKKTNYKWLSMYGSYNRVDHCSFVGKTHLGTTLTVELNGEPNYHRIDHNYFGPRPVLGMNGGETIRVGTSQWSLTNSRTTVEDNLFQNCDGEIEIVSNKSCENVYRGNTFLESQGCMTFRHGRRCVVEGNFFLGKGKKSTGGVRIIGEDHKVYNNYFADLTGEDARSALSTVNGVVDSPLYGYYQVQRAIIAYNTFINCRSNIVIGLPGTKTMAGTLPMTDSVIANNIVQSSQGPLVRILTPPVNLRWESNIFHGAEPGVENNPGIKLVDPQLKQTTDGLWRSQPGSPARGGGSGDFSFIKDDIDGQVRSGKFDIGCDQVSNDPVVRRPISVDMVGTVVGASWKVNS